MLERFVVQAGHSPIDASARRRRRVEHVREWQPAGAAQTHTRVTESNDYESDCSLHAHGDTLHALAAASCWLFTKVCTCRYMIVQYL